MQAEYARHQRERDEAAAVLHEVLVQISSVAGHLHGKHKLGAFIGRLPRRPYPLLRLGRGLTWRFDRPDGDWSAESTPIAKVFDMTPARWIQPIRKRTLALGEAIGNATRSETRVASARIERKRALERFNVRFPDLAQALVGLYQLSGHGELAASFRPSRQDPGLTLALAKQRRAKRGGKTAEPSTDAVNGS